jgi:hypothetical protein
MKGRDRQREREFSRPYGTPTILGNLSSNEVLV